MHVGAADYDFRPYIYNIPLFDSEAGDAQAADASGVHGPGGVSTEPLTPIAEGSAGELADSGGGSLLKLGNGGGGGGGNGALVQAAVEEAQSSGGGGGNDGRDVSGDGSGGVSHRSVPLVAEAQDVAAEDEPRPLASPGRLLGAVTGAVKGALGSLPGLNPRHKHHHSGAEAAVTAAAAAVVGVPAVCAAGGGAQASSRESQPLAAALAAAAGLMTSGTGGNRGEGSGDGRSGGAAGEEFFERPSKRGALVAAADAGGGQDTSAGGADVAGASVRSTKPLMGSYLAPLFGTKDALGSGRAGSETGTAGPPGASEGKEWAESGSPARPTEWGGERGAEGVAATPGAVAASVTTSSPDTSRRSGWLGRLSGFRAWAPSGQLLAGQGGSGSGMARSVSSHASSSHTTAPPLPKAATIAAPRFEASREAAASGGAGAGGGAAGGDGWGVAGRAAAVWGSALRWLAWALPGPLASALRSGRLSSLAEASAAVRRAGKAAARALQGTPGVVGAALPPTGVAWPAALPADPRLTPPEAAGGDEGAVPRLHAAAVDANGGRTVGGSAAARSRESAKAAAVPAGVAGAGPDVAVAAPARGLMSAVGLLHIALSDIRLEAKDVYHFSVRVLPAALHACIVCDRLAFGTYPAATRMQHAASTRTMHHASHASNVLPLTCPLTAGEAKRAKRACANLCTCMPAQLQGGVHSLSQGGRELI